MRKINQKEILRSVLTKSNIPSSYYSLEGYAEGAECLEETSNGYKVYHASGGKKYHEEEFTLLPEACHNIITRLAYSIEYERELVNDFITAILNEAYE